MESSCTRDPPPLEMIGIRFFTGYSDPLSNFYPSKFEYQGQIFNCVEQFFQYFKAIEFGDIKTAEQIMATSDPKKQKALGRKVKNFDSEIWCKKCLDVMQLACTLKFENPWFKQILIETYPLKLAEASKYDNYWGIGYNSSDVGAKKMTNWGRNYMGIILGRIRDKLLYL